MEIIITAFQSLPNFVQELKDERAIENETVVFECQFSGNPTPGYYLNPLTVVNSQIYKINFYFSGHMVS